MHKDRSNVIFLDKQLANNINEPHCGNTGFLLMRKQRRRSAPLFALHG